MKGARAHIMEKKCELVKSLAATVGEGTLWLRAHNHLFLKAKEDRVTGKGGWAHLFLNFQRVVSC